MDRTDPKSRAVGRPRRSCPVVSSIHSSKWQPIQVNFPTWHLVRILGPKISCESFTSKVDWGHDQSHWGPCGELETGPSAAFALSRGEAETLRCVASDTENTEMACHVFNIWIWIYLNIIRLVDIFDCWVWIHKFKYEFQRLNQRINYHYYLSSVDLKHSCDFCLQSRPRAPPAMAKGSWSPLDPDFEMVDLQNMWICLFSKYDNVTDFYIFLQIFLCGFNML